MFEFLKRKRKLPVVYKRQEHCVSRANIDPDALKVLYRLHSLGYTAYLVGGGVRDLLMGRKPKDFDVGTSALPNEVKHAFRNCFLIGRRFRLAHVRFAGGKIIETATFRQNSQSVGEIIERAAEGPQEDNTFGTPETDAYRRDFTVNGLFYNIADFSVIDWVGGMDDIRHKIIRAIGNPGVRFQEEWAAMKKHHACILLAATPRVCEEVFRLFTYSHAAEAFELLWACGMLGDLVPELAQYIDRTGGRKSPVFRYLKALDAYDAMMTGKGFEVSNGLRAAVLMTGLFQEERKLGAGRKVIQLFTGALKAPKAVYFTGAILLDSTRRLAEPPKKNKTTRFIHSRDFLDALDYNRIIARADGRSEAVLDEWAKLYDDKHDESYEER